MTSRSLADWLAYIERLHPRSIELGLDRVRAVLETAGLAQPPFAVITIAGTNGKGSTVALCDAMLRAGGYRVGAYTSPHLVQYNERVRVDGVMASDEELCSAFERIEQARGTMSLTYFEFGTLAALEIFRARAIEIAVLEVGMGGRLDAVNAVDPDVAVVTSIGIDHTAWLGPDRESIGREKAGIFRSRRPAICCDPAPPASIAGVATAVSAELKQRGRDFFIDPANGGWVLRTPERMRAGLPYPALRGDYQLGNAAGAILALDALAARFPLTQTHVRLGLVTASVPGRFQVLPGLPVTVLDVAHNADAARALAHTLAQQQCAGRTLAVFGMLIDKPIADVARVLATRVDRWYAVTLASSRGASAEHIEAALRQAGVTAEVERHDDPVSAFMRARDAARPIDRVVAFGSFHTVGAILAHLPQR